MQRMLKPYGGDVPDLRVLRGAAGSRSEEKLSGYPKAVVKKLKKDLATWENL